MENTSPHEYAGPRQVSVIPRFETRIEEHFAPVSLPEACKSAVDRIRKIAIANSNTLVEQRVVVTADTNNSILAWKRLSFAMDIQSFNIYVDHSRLWEFGHRKHCSHILEWREFEAHRIKKRRCEEEAVYALDNEDVGSGTPGFRKALDKLAAIPAGSTVGVVVCARLTPPFENPAVCRNLEHFERTGVEPYVDLIQMLFELVDRNGRRVILIPDEEK